MTEGTGGDFADDDSISSGILTPSERPVSTEAPVTSEQTTPEDSLEVSDDDDAPLLSSVDADDEGDEDRIAFDQHQIDLRGEPLEDIRERLTEQEARIGNTMMEARTRTVGTWENNMFRTWQDASLEEQRIQQALASFSAEERAGMSDRYKENGKVVLKTSALSERIMPGTRKRLSGDDALAAFEFQEVNGGFRIPLYNSGLTIDVLVPTGIDLQTMLTNCWVVDRDLGTAMGAHYFAYNDLMYKTQVLNFLKPLIVNSSLIDWKKNNRLWTVIKLNDLEPILANLAALCYPTGFDNFVTRCTRPTSEAHPNGCQHTETTKANIFNLIATRFPAMNASAIEHMAAARMNKKHTLKDIAVYQANLGLEGEKLVFDNISFTMRIPTLNEHLEAGSKFISDIINEIEGDNSAGRYEQFGLRYLRTFLPWIGLVEQTGNTEDVLETDDTRVITRVLEKLERKVDPNALRDAFVAYINKSQLTYVGWPATPCPSCGYVAETPSGMMTFDPFTAFFTAALTSSKLTF